MEMYRRIKELRLQRGLSQDELAEKVGYTSRSSIAKVEAGKVDLSQSKILLFANALGVSSADLLGIEDPGERNTSPSADTELNDYLEELRTRPEMRMLFHTFKGATKEHIEAIVSAWEALNGRKQD